MGFRLNLLTAFNNNHQEKVEVLLTLLTHLILCKRWLGTERIKLILYMGKHVFQGPVLRTLKHILRFDHAQPPPRSARHRTLPALKDATRAEFFQGCSNSSCFKTLFGYLFCPFPKVCYSMSHETSEPQLWKDLL